MRVTVHYLAQLKRYAGVSSETIETAGTSTLSGLLEVLAGLHGDGFRAALLDEQGQPRPALLFFLGDDQVRPHEARPLREGDEVTILSPMAGG